MGGLSARGRTAGADPLGGGGIDSEHYRKLSEKPSHRWPEQKPRLRYGSQKSVAGY
jgi:hypothetical protein